MKGQAMGLFRQPWRKPHFVVYGTLLLIAFSGLGHRLADPDEGRYAEIPREMIERGDWITPTLNYVPYFEKPPLLYWLLATSMTVFGEHEWAIRIVPASFALLGLLLVFRLATQTIGAAAARWAPALLFTTTLYFVMARLPLTDTVFAVFLAGAMTAWWDWEQSGGTKRWAAVVTGVFLGLALLSKGPVAVVLFVGAVGLYLLAARRLSWRTLASAGGAVAVACAIATPWFLAVAARNPGFNHYFFVVQHFNRYSGQNFTEHVKPFWYFLPVTVAAIGIWAALWPWAIARFPATWRRSLPEQRQGWLYLLAWSAFPIFFFSLSSCKLVTYGLPVQWPLAVLSAYATDRLLRRDQVTRGVRGMMIAVAALVLLVLVWGVGRLASRDPDLSSSPVTATSFAILIGAWLFAAAGLVVGPRLRPPQWRWGVLALSAALGWGGLLPAYGDLTKGMHLSGVLPETLRAEGPGRDCTLAEYRDYNQSLGFYTHKRVLLIDEVDELKLGLEEPDAAYWFRKGEGAIDELSQRGPLALVVNARRASELAADHHLWLYRANADRALLLNQSAVKLLAVGPNGSVPHAQ